MKAAVYERGLRRGQAQCCAAEVVAQAVAGETASRKIVREVTLLGCSCVISSSKKDLLRCGGVALRNAGNCWVG